MMRAAIYRPAPGDSLSGDILMSFEGSEINLGANLAAHSPAGFVVVDAAVSTADFQRLDATHRVAGGALVPLGSTA